MKRLALIGSWKRLGVQAGLLGGLGLAFMGTQEKPAEAGGQCLGEQCLFKKPNFLIILDYSSSMHNPFQGAQTNWDAAVEAIQNLITTQGGYFDARIHFALMRFGHQGGPGMPLGQSLDVEWYDQQNDPTGYYECNGQTLVDFLTNVQPPPCNAGGPPPSGCSGMGTWTNGAMQFSQDIVAQTRADHPADQLGPQLPRRYFNLLLTDGAWTSANGTTQQGPPSENPAITAGDLFNNDDVQTYVVAFGNALGNAFADEIALAGGTGASIQVAGGLGLLTAALEDVVEDIEQQVIQPECIAGLPRIMVILDASSSMLNVNGQPGAMGATGWDQARDALAGMPSLFDLPTGIPAQPPAAAPVVADVVHLGLTVFGSSPAQPAGAEERVLVDYGPCMQDNISWALDPNTSCGAGCNNPWGGPPITWTFVGPGDAAYPGFDQDTYSHMPRCDQAAPGITTCSGSATFTHRGLDLADNNYHAYLANPPPLYNVDPNTTIFINILITDGAYNTWSTDPQVQAELVHMHGTDGITTYVIGFGQLTAGNELVNMACWGSGGSGLPCNGGSVPHFEAANQNELEMALQQIIETLTFDPCCAFNECAFNPEPTTNEPDPQHPDPETSTGPEPMTTTDTPTTTDGVTTDDGVVDDTTAGDEDDDVTPDGTAEEGSASQSDSADATNTSPTTMTGPTTQTSADGDGTDTDPGADGGGGDDGCGCRTDEPAPRGWLGGLFMLGLLGLARRRR